MTYNLWAREDVAVYRRMQAIGDLVRQHKPDVIFFQEVTHYILEIFDKLDILKDYRYGRSRSIHKARNQDFFCLLLSKLPLDRFNSESSGQYLHARIKPRNGMVPIHATTARLRSLVRCNERLLQAERYVSDLDKEENALLGGDMFWDDDVDMPFPLRHGWVDAWSHLGLQDDLGSSWTYDGIWTEEVRAFNGFTAPLSSLRKRPDRFVCKLKDYMLKSIEVIGSDGVGLHYQKGPHARIDLLPSCHRGLVLTIVANGRPSADHLALADPEQEGCRMIMLQESEDYPSDYYLLD
ncbi:unnamed protein product [Urochloa humidicola]